jgi:dsRNA-specific ribonuclease
VLLPLLVDPTLRLFSGRRVWKSQRNAKKDVAFQAYLALYKAGLVNENLMPVKGVDPDQEFLKTGVEERPGIVVASKQLDPWVEVAKAWEGVRHSQQVYSSVLTLRDGGEMTSFELVLPMPLPLIPPFHLFWSYEKTLTITISEPVAKEIDIKDLLRLQEQARMLLDATFNYRFQVPRSDLLALFLDPLYPASWQSNLCNPCPIENISELLAKGPDMGIIHQKGIPSNRFTFLSHLDALNSLPNSQSLQYGMRDEIMEASSPPYLHLKKLSNKLDFLQPVFQTRKRDLKTYILSLAECDIEQVPWRTTRFGLLIPSIMRRLGLYLLADLCRMTLPNIGISDINLLFTAIRKVQNDEGENYERFEFIGDSILKLLTSIQLLTDYPLWPEGFLSAKRDRIINNSRLSRAALHVGLDKFIVTEYWHAKKWRPPTIGEVLENESQQSNLRREISTKTLADVVEALIGAASVEGGFEKSVECLRVFLPEIDWRPMESNIEKMYESTPTNILLPATLEPLEELIDYRFKKKTLLIEAMTHASYTVGRASMERLEFLGDAVLDSIINKELYSFKGRDLSPYEMTTIKSAMSNRHFLAFMCMEWSLTRNTNNVVLDDEHPEKFTIISSATTLALWQFMRFNSVHIATSQQKTVSTYKMLRQQIRDAIAYGSHYPWVLLNQLFADKFFSDIVESLLGALFVDSGALDACHGILERMGLLGCLRCILDNGTVVLTPEVELGNFAGQQWRAKVRYVIDIEKSVERGDGSGGYSCEVFVGEKSIVVVRGGATKDESRMRAAEEALRILRLDLNVRAEPAVAD